MDERRSEVRMMCADMVEIRWRDRAGGEQSTTAILEDISSSGASLQVESPIPLGVELRWHQPRQVFHKPMGTSARAKRMTFILASTMRFR